jgi:hypothetical protein
MTLALFGWSCAAWLAGCAAARRLARRYGR